MSEPKYTLGRVVGTAIMTCIASLALSGLVMLGADRQRLETAEEKIESHIERAEERIKELEVLKQNQVAVAVHLKNIDETLKEIKAELQRYRNR